MRTERTDCLLPNPVNAGEIANRCKGTATLAIGHNRLGESRTDPWQILQFIRICFIEIDAHLNGWKNPGKLRPHIIERHRATNVRRQQEEESKGKCPRGQIRAGST